MFGPRRAPGRFPPEARTILLIKKGRQWRPGIDSIPMIYGYLRRKGPLQSVSIHPPIVPPNPSAATQRHWSHPGISSFWNSPTRQSSIFRRWETDPGRPPPPADPSSMRPSSLAPPPNKKGRLLLRRPEIAGKEKSLRSGPGRAAGPSGEKSAFLRHFGGHASHLTGGKIGILLHPADQFTDGRQGDVRKKLLHGFGIHHGIPFNHVAKNLP